MAHRHDEAGSAKAGPAERNHHQSSAVRIADKLTGLSEILLATRRPAEAAACRYIAADVLHLAATIGTPIPGPA